MKREEDYIIRLDRRTDEIVDRYRYPERICHEARVRGIADTDSWYIAAVEMAKKELAKERRLQ